MSKTIKPPVTLRAGAYEAKILATVGGNLISLRRGKVHALRAYRDEKQVAENPVVFGLPVLFPPNRIDRGTFTFEGRVYHFPVTEAFSQNSIHGFLYDQSWQVEEQKQDSVTVCFRSNRQDDNYEYYPHDFVIRLRYELCEQGLTQTVLLSNEGDCNMPFGLGFHSAFTLRMTEHSRPEDVTMQVSVGDRIPLNERLLPSSPLQPLSPEQQALRQEGQNPLATVMNDHFTTKSLKRAGKPFHGAILEDHKAQTRVVYEVDPVYQHWMIWNCNQEGSFVCIEPQTWRVNAPNLDLPAFESGMGWVKPGQTFTAQSSLAIESAASD